MKPDAYLFTVRRESKSGKVTSETFAAIDFSPEIDEKVTVLKKEPLYLLTDAATMPTYNEGVLRAMANNYGNGPHAWDFLDRTACIKAADEIKELRSIIDTLRN
jgi:hypothetical protein